MVLHGLICNDKNKIIIINIMKKLIYILPLLFIAQISFGQQTGTLKTLKVQGSGGGGTGTVTSVSKTDGYGYSSTITNPTTTPNIAGSVDTTVIVSKPFLATELGGKQDTSFVTSIYVKFPTKTVNDSTITYSNGLVSEASNTTINTDCDTTLTRTVTALSTDATIANPTGTPEENQHLTIRIKDDGTPHNLTFGSEFRFSSTYPAPTATVASATLYLECRRNVVDSTWDVLFINSF